MIPCIKNKCILFPICKHKNRLVCDILADHILSLHKRMGGTQVWININQSLPILIAIHAETKIQGHYKLIDKITK